MTLRHTFLLSVAFGASLLGAPAYAQVYGGNSSYSLPGNEPEETGTLPADVPPGAVSGYEAPPGYRDPYARPAPYGQPGARDAVERTDLGAPSGAQQAPVYTPPATGSAPAAQPYPQGGYQQGGYQQGAYPQAPAQQSPYGQQPSYPQASYPQGGYQQGTYQQAPAQATYGAQPAYGTQATYGGQAVAPAEPPAGVYGANAAVVPGTQEAPSGPRIENVDPTEPVPERFRRQTVDYVTTQPAGTIIIDTPNTYLYYVVGGGKAIRYGIGVGREGFTWAGTEKITGKKEWADWRPPAEMIQRQPYLPRFMAGGPGNPLGARTMYLGGTIYRIHGTNEPQTIGKFVSSGCFRMLNNDVEDLYDRVKVGTRVVILPKPSSTSVQANAGAAPAPVSPR